RVIPSLEVFRVDHEAPRQPEQGKVVDRGIEGLRRLATRADEHARARRVAPPTAVIGSAPARHLPLPYASDHERGSAAAGPLDVRVVEVEARGHQLLPVVEDRAVEIEEALAVDEQLGPVVLEDPVALAR